MDAGRGVALFKMFSNDDVRRQLSLLGYRDVPDEILGKFVDRLRNAQGIQGQPPQAAAPEFSYEQSYEEEPEPEPVRKSPRLAKKRGLNERKGHANQQQSARPRATSTARCLAAARGQAAAATAMAPRACLHKWLQGRVYTSAIPTGRRFSRKRVREDNQGGEGDEKG